MKRLAILVMVFLIAGCGTLIPKESYSSASSGFQSITVDELSAKMETKDFLLVNVHVPHGGDIPGTDFTVPYDQIKDKLSLFPAEKQSEIVLYCRSSVMGEIAAQALADQDYKNVYNLQGGYEVWKEAGLPFGN